MEKGSKYWSEKKKYLNNTKVLLFNLELLCFMDIETARKHYFNVIKDINHNDKFRQCFDYFERTWFPVTDSDPTIYGFNLWNYRDKFKLKEIKINL